MFFAQDKSLSCTLNFYMFIVQGKYFTCFTLCRTSAVVANVDYRLLPEVEFTSWLTFFSFSTRDRTMARILCEGLMASPQRLLADDR